MCLELIKRIGILFSIILLIIGCGEKEVVSPVTYNNILIYADLSSRLNSSNNDLKTIHSILDYFKDECVKPGKKDNDRSSISFNKINKNLTISCNKPKIDISSIQKIDDKSRYVNDTDPENNLSKSMKSFKDDVYCYYQNRDEFGIDLISLINYEIENNINPKVVKITYDENGDTSAIHNYNNKLILFTDGYLEFRKNIYNEKNYFGQKQIQAVRDYCIKHNVSLMEAITKNTTFNIPTSINQKNKFIELYVMETFERDRDDIKGLYKFGLELSDNNILKAVWTKWANDSGFKSFKWRTHQNGEVITIQEIKNFLESK